MSRPDDLDIIGDIIDAMEATHGNTQADPVPETREDISTQDSALGSLRTLHVNRHKQRP